MGELSLQRNSLNSDTFQKVFNTFLFIYAALEILATTVVGKYFIEWMERGQILLSIILITLVVASFFQLRGEEKRTYIKRQSLIILYFLIRLITFITTGMEYTMARSVIFEGLYLIVLTGLVIDSEFVKKYVFSFLIFTNLGLNIINTIVNLYCEPMRLGKISEDKFYIFTYYHTYLGDFPNYSYSSMYSNPNHIGMLTGLAVLIALSLYDSKMNKIIKLLYPVYILFSLYCIWYSNCSSSQVGTIAVVLAWIIVKFVKPVTPKKIVYLCLACCIAVTCTMQVYISKQLPPGEPYTEIEMQLEDKTTTRYSVWKDAYFSHKEEILLGCGNVSLEKLDRSKYESEIGIYNGGLSILDMKGLRGTHSGYLGMFYCTGLLGSLVFLLILIQKIRKSQFLEKDLLYYLTMVFLLVVNLVENQTIIRNNPYILLVLLILEMKKVKESDICNSEILRNNTKY